MAIPNLTEAEIKARCALANRIANSPEGRQEIKERNVQAMAATKELQAKRRPKLWMLRRPVTI